MNDLSVIEAEFGDLSPYQNAPDFWVAKPDKGMPLIRTLQQAVVQTIGKSAGGRDILAIEYGPKEPLDATSNNLASAMASGVSNPDPTQIFPEVFYGSQRRKRPVVVFQGAIHGGELTGTAACLNLCRVIETGNDLRGKAWPALQAMARELRICILPWLNIDGAVRWPLANPHGAPQDLTQRCTQGVAADGTKYIYPAVKRFSLIPPDKTAFMGAYYNDAGVNLQYDFCMPERQPETKAWMEYYLAEKPDGVVIWHCNAGSMIGPPDSNVPTGFQHELSRLGGAVRQRLLREGYAIGRLSWAGLPGMGKSHLDQVNSTYHVCGAMPIMCELPGAGGDALTLEEVLDIGLITIEEILFYALHDGLRPYELWEKVKKILV